MALFQKWRIPVGAKLQVQKVDPERWEWADKIPDAAVIQDNLLPYLILWYF